MGTVRYGSHSYGSDYSDSTLVYLATNDKAVRILLLHGERLQAIKVFRALHRTTLRQAVTAVDAAKRRLGY
jgi:hypothetical protein